LHPPGPGLQEGAGRLPAGGPGGKHIIHQENPTSPHPFPIGDHEGLLQVPPPRGLVQPHLGQGGPASPEHVSRQGPADGRRHWPGQELTLIVPPAGQPVRVEGDGHHQGDGEEEELLPGQKAHEPAQGEGQLRLAPVLEPVDGGPDPAAVAGDGPRPPERRRVEAAPLAVHRPTQETDQGPLEKPGHTSKLFAGLLGPDRLATPLAKGFHQPGQSIEARGAEGIAPPAQPPVPADEAEGRLGVEPVHPHPGQPHPSPTGLGPASSPARAALRFMARMAATARSAGHAGRVPAKRTRPWGSSQLRPARPAIWTNAPASHTGCSGKRTSTSTAGRVTPRSRREVVTSTPAPPCRKRSTSPSRWECPAQTAPTASPRSRSMTGGRAWARWTVGTKITRRAPRARAAVIHRTSLAGQARGWDQTRSRGSQRSRGSGSGWP